MVGLSSNTYIVMAIHAKALDLHEPSILIPLNQFPGLLELRFGRIGVDHNLVSVRRHDKGEVIKRSGNTGKS